VIVEVFFPLILVPGAFEIDARLLEFLCPRSILRLEGVGFGRGRLSGGGFVAVAIVGTIQRGQHLALLDELSFLDEYARHAPAHLESRLRCNVGFN